MQRSGTVVKTSYGNVRTQHVPGDCLHVCSCCILVAIALLQLHMNELVLSAEITHNIHLQHNAAFWKLNRELKEVRLWEFRVWAPQQPVNSDRELSTLNLSPDPDSAGVHDLQLCCRH